MIRVFVAATHQLVERLRAMRSIVVAAREIERSDGVVDRSDREDANAAGGRRRITDDRGFRRLQIFPKAAASLDARAGERVRSRRLRSGRDQDDLLRSEIDQFVDEANEARRPVAQAMRLAAPVALGCERDTVPVGREGQRQRCGDRVGQMIPADAGPKSWEGSVGGKRFRVSWDKTPDRANVQFEGPMDEGQSASETPSTRSGRSKTTCSLRRMECSRCCSR